MRILVVVLLVFAFSSIKMQAQTASYLYNTSEVAKIEVFIDNDSLQVLLDPANAESDHEFPVNMVYTTSSQSDTVWNIGFRLRGNTSRISQKKSFKISFNTFTAGKRFYGVKKMNLNGEHNDPSISRSRLCWKMATDDGLKVSRFANAELYINGVYKGLYINIEHINDDWLAQRYGGLEEGNLYKCTYPADLRYITSNPNSYKLTNGDGTRIYELKTNESQDDYSDLEQLIRLLNNIPASQLECGLDSILDLEGFLEALAFEVTTGHWDNYSFNKNNYYLYKNPQNNKFEYLLYDMDNTFGVDWFNIDWASRNVNSWINTQSNLPLASRLLALPQLKEIYKFYLRKFNTQLSNPQLISHIDSIYNQIKPFAEADTFKGLDYGFTNDDFRNSFDSTAAQLHVKKGIKTYIAQRVSNTTNQLGSFNVAPIIRQLDFVISTQSDEATITAFIEDETAVNVLCNYSLNGGTIQSITLYDDGLHQDKMAADGFYGNSIHNLIHGEISYQLTATDQNSQTRLRPCSPKTTEIPIPKKIIINELMADNDNFISDQAGLFSDWIELYNNSQDTIALSQYFLTDQISNPNQWAFPDTLLYPNAFYLVWASGDTSIASNHSNFKLSKDGEEIGIFKLNSTQYDTIDYLVFGNQSTDISFGRTYDASPIWQFFTSATPNASNGTAGIAEKSNQSIQIFPNPYCKAVNFENLSEKDIEISVQTLLGQSLDLFILKGREKILWKDPQGKGIRIISYTDENNMRVQKLISE